MAVNKDTNPELILLFSDNDVASELAFSEFEAVLDNYVQLPGFASTRVSGAYIKCAEEKSKPQMRIILFKLRFDAQGLVDAKWNLSLRALDRKADTQDWFVDIVAHPGVRVLTQKQCPEQNNAKLLWKIELDQVSEIAADIKQRVSERHKWELEAPQVNVTPVIPVLDPVSHAAPQTLDPYDGLSSSSLESQLAVIENENRRKITALMREHKIQMEEQDERHRVVLNTTQEHYEKRLVQYERRQQELEYMQGYNEQKLTALTEQLAETQRALIQAGSRERELFTQNDQLRANLDASEEHKAQALDQLSEQLLSAAEVRYEQDTGSLRQEISDRDHSITKLEGMNEKMREELCELRRDTLRLTGQGGDKFLERLDQSGISFIAFHPGAGHLSIPLNAMSDYLEDPVQYAANHCNMDIDAYRNWLQHYEKPACVACGVPIVRIDIPQAFKPGVHDCCDKHQGSAVALMR